MPTVDLSDQHEQQQESGDDVRLAKHDDHSNAVNSAHEISEESKKILLGSALRRLQSRSHNFGNRMITRYEQGNPSITDARSKIGSLREGEETRKQMAEYLLKNIKILITNDVSVDQNSGITYDFCPNDWESIQRVLEEKDYDLVITGRSLSRTNQDPGEIFKIQQKGTRFISHQPVCPQDSRNDLISIGVDSVFGGGDLGGQIQDLLKRSLSATTRKSNAGDSNVVAWTPARESLFPGVKEI